ncbi:histidinol phosphatase [Corynebacterium atypicum]|uniref:Histidinol phosphatase n=1 Tax=Corynebacterium atypicum TaxID=191610 RepID=A0ABN4DDV7_9CORY|nr:ABC transporter ATP-binding protein [Corynebacterium atypicum]AIG64650.1 histidinol phosphatase [Corynebacterium atypicum]
MITACGITVDRGGTRVLDGVDLEVFPQETLGLVGPNGSGKTTLLRCLFGAVSPTAGTVTIDGVAVHDWGRRELARTLAVVTQEHESDIPIRVAELVMLGRLPHLGLTTKPGEEDEEIVAEALASLGALHLATRDMLSLSGGERQRALIARSLAQRTPYIFLDEPTNHLDVRYQYDLLDLLAHKQGSTTVVLHDLNLAAEYCDRIVLLDSGRVVKTGTPDEVFRPEVLEPVYRAPVERLDVNGRIVLLFSKANDEFRQHIPH